MVEKLYIDSNIDHMNYIEQSCQVYRRTEAVVNFPAGLVRW